MRLRTDWSDNIHAAIRFVRIAHKGQKRKYIGGNYVDEHCIPVMEAIITKYPDDENMHVAALLHDTIEDTGVTAAELAQAFSPDVADLVFDLTDEFTAKAYPGLNRLERTDAESRRLGGISDRAKAIKLADINNNISNIVANDPGFAVIYLREKAFAIEQIIRDNNEKRNRSKN